MSRLPRLVMMVLIAMFIVAAPTAGAQSPVADQYEIPLCLLYTSDAADE